MPAHEIVKAGPSPSDHISCIKRATATALVSVKTYVSNNELFNLSNTLDEGINLESRDESVIAKEEASSTPNAYI